jgi:hypothetical protein
MTHKVGYINWNYSGKADFLYGTGATTWEKGLVLAGGSLGIVLYLYHYITGTLDWSWWNYLLASLIGMDVFAGLVANS